ncbi:MULTISPECIES: endonuclease/exonuclease/phosphatase family protein [Streptomyces]|uniref:endonuclease/exonuclease/phosphatase family protein n=1 Tax=Streptomyces TaxID=1883 RepID=UPI00345BE8EF
MLSTPQAEGRDLANSCRARLIGSAGFLQGADVIVLQGLFDTTSTQQLLRALTRRGFVHQTPSVCRRTSDRPSGAPRTHDGSASGGTAVVSRYVITRAEEHLFPEPSGTCAEVRKGFTYAAVRARGGTLHLFGAHLHSGRDRADRDVRERQLAFLAGVLAQGEKNGTLPPQDMVVIAGTLNVPYDSSEYAHMLHVLRAERPTAKLGWPYSFDTINNTIARRRHTRPAVPPRRAPQDLDHVLLRHGHPRPSKWNSRVLVSRTPWTAGSRHYTDYSGHQPVLAGATITARPGHYDLILTAIRVTHRPTTADSWPILCGAVTVTTDTSGPHVVWERALPRARCSPPGTNLLHHPLLFPSSTAFAIQTDLTHCSPSPCGRDNTLAYGTLWWQAGARLGRHAVHIEGNAGSATITFTTRLASTQNTPVSHTTGPTPVTTPDRPLHSP